MIFIQLSLPQVLALHNYRLTYTAFTMLVVWAINLAIFILGFSLSNVWIFSHSKPN